MKLNFCLKSLKILMIQFIDLNFLLSLNIAMIIINTIMILMYLLRKSPLSKKRLIFCRSLWKKKLMKLRAHWMKKMMRRAKNKWRKNGLITRAHLLMIVTLKLIHCLSFLPKDECHDNFYDPVDLFEISLFDELDACYACGQDANMNCAYGDELAIVPYVKNEIVASAPTHDIL